MAPEITKSTCLNCTQLELAPTIRCSITFLKKPSKNVFYFVSCTVCPRDWCKKTVHSTTECGLTACTGSLVSPWAQKLWQWTSWGFSSQKPSHSITPPNHKTITRASQGRSGGGKRDLEETTNPPQQQLFPNHNNLGKGCGLYFMGGEGLWMFIYLSQQSALRCACVFTQDLSSLSALFYFTFTFTLNSNICQSCV